jgi:hypothetical protein
MAETKGVGGDRDALSSFLAESEAFLGAVLETIANAVGDDDDAPLIVSHSGAAQEQLGKLTQHVRTNYARANVELRRQVDEFMQTQAVTTLARNGQAAFRQQAVKGIFGDGTFSWIETVLQEIKKVIEWLSNMFQWPDWITKLIQVLDQIMKAVIGLFGGILGRSRPKIMAELSALEVGFWNELAAHRRFALIGRSSAEEESD